MADASEDALRAARPSSPHSTTSSTDEDDSPQDFRFLPTLTTSQSSSLPRRGTKDFEPDPTRLQSSTLAASRAAMHAALSHTRVHAPKGHVVGVFDARTRVTRVRRAMGPLFKSLGKGVGGGVELVAEEALWALERGALDVRWGVEGDVGDADGREEAVYGDRKDEEGDEHKVLEEGEGAVLDDDAQGWGRDLGLLPMSLQGAYAAYLGVEGGLTLEKYLVYAGLKRAGFIVLRAEGFNGRPAPQTKSSRVMSEATSTKSVLAWLYSLLLRRKETDNGAERQRLGPLVKPGLYRNYDEIYRLLHLIPAGHHTTLPHSPTHQTACTPDPTIPSQPPTNHPFTTTFNLYKPSPSFRKSAPGPPAFRICVVDARATRVPTLSQLSDLLDEQPDWHPLAAGERNALSVPGMYRRLKQEGRNVVLAVVDEGVVSYMRVSEAGFAEEKVFERVGRATAGKRGGGGAGRGMGGGRGGRGERGGRGKGGAG